MNQPEYILVDEFAGIVEAVRVRLNLPVLNYQYGYRKEIDETLVQWAKTPEYAAKKFPMVYLAQPFTIQHRGQSLVYGQTNDVRLFILHHTSKNYKAAERMAEVYKTVIYPIYRALLGEIGNRTDLFYTAGPGALEYDEVDYYYWGEGNAAVFTDAVDCKTIFNLRLTINNNLNCVAQVGRKQFI